MSWNTLFFPKKSGLVTSPHEALKITTTNPIRYYGKLLTPFSHSKLQEIFCKQATKANIAMMTVPATLPGVQGWCKQMTNPSKGREVPCWNETWPNFGCSMWVGCMLTTPNQFIRSFYFKHFSKFRKYLDSTVDLFAISSPAGRPAPCQPAGQHRFCVALWTRVTLGLDMCKVCTEAVHCVALWTRVTLGLDMWKVCTETVRSVALWTRVTLGLDMCKVCTEAVHCVALWTRVALGLDMCKVCTEAVHCVALWTRVTLGLDICKVCTEAVHCVAPWTRVTLGLDMCKVCTEAVRSVALWTRVTLGLDMCKVCTEAAHCVALWTRVTFRFGHV